MSCFKTVFYGFPDDGMEILKFLKIMVRKKSKSLTARWVKVSQVAEHGILFFNRLLIKCTVLLIRSLYP